nr:hypothetical protein MarFTME_247 [Marseillevirus futianmevirus]
MQFFLGKEREEFAISSGLEEMNLPKGWDELPTTLKRQVFYGSEQRRWSFFFCCGGLELEFEVSLSLRGCEYHPLVVYFDMFLSADSRTFSFLGEVKAEFSKIEEYLPEEEQEKFVEWCEKIF